MLKHRARLKEIYDSTMSDAEKRVAKARVFEELRNDYAKLKSGWNGYAAFDNWFKQDLNNAHLAAIGLYSQYVAAFQKLLAQQAGNLAAFYGAVEEIKRMPAAERDVVLQKIGGLRINSTDWIPVFAKIHVISAIQDRSEQLPRGSLA